MLCLHNEIAKTRPRRDADDKIILTCAHLLLLQLLVALHTRLSLGVAARRIRLNPLEFVLKKLAARVLGLCLTLEHRLLLLEPFLVVALVWIADAVVEFENPVRNIRKEVAVMGDNDERTLELLEIRLETERRFRIEMVRWLVEKKNIRIRKQKTADRNAAALATGKHLYRRIAGRASHIRHGTVNEVIDVPIVLGIDDLLKPLHLCGSLGVIQLAAEILVALNHRLRIGNALGNNFCNGLGIIKLRLLRKISDLGALRHLHRSHKLGINTGENLEKRGLTRAIAADHTDVRPIEETEIDILQNGLVACLLSYIYETELIFARHVYPFIYREQLGAGRGIRTPDQRFTKPLRYHYAIPAKGV